MSKNSRVRIPLLAVLGGLCLVAACRQPAGEWQSESGYRWRTLASPVGGADGFREVKPARTGIIAANHIFDQQAVANRNMLHGSGVAVGDVDGDGLPDLYVARLSHPNVLYRNEGQWRFTDITDKAGVALAEHRSTGVAMADIDGDGDLDLLVTMLTGPGAVLRNDGRGHFEDVTETSGLRSSYGATTMALADVDSDQDLDLYVARYKRIALRDSLSPEEITWEKVMKDTSYAVKPEFENHYRFRAVGDKMMRVELGEPDALYLNDGSGRFSPVSWTDGAFRDAQGRPLVDAPRDWALTARFYDVNGDGNPDLYVCNDFEGEDVLWMGDGRGTFRMAAPEVLRKISNATMSVDYADIDRDGHVDFFLTDMLSRDHVMRLRQRNTRIPEPIAAGDLTSRPQEMQNTLFVNRGDGTFSEVANLSGVSASDWSWSTSFLDVDLDGYEDLLITTGHLFDVQDLDAQAIEQQRLRHATDAEAARSLILDFPRLSLHNVAFRNQGDRTFTAMPDGWGIGSEADISHGMALGDLDHDGDLDVVINRLNQIVGLYENTSKGERLAVQLKGPAVNRQGIGANIRVQCPGLPPQQKEVTAAGQYQSSSEAMTVFAGAGPHCIIDVVWPDQSTSTVTQASPGRLYEVAYQGGAHRPVAGSRDMPVFSHMQRIPRSPEQPYDDFARQPLLPKRLSLRGPGAAAADLDGDGWTDLVVGGAMGEPLTVYLNEEGELREVAVGVEASGDMTGVLVMPGGPSGDVRIMAGVSNYERTPESTGDSSYIAVYSFRLPGTLEVVQHLPFGSEAPGPLALADLDGDQDLDLFVGGSFLPGAYPMPVSSRIYRNAAGVFAHDAAMSRPFAQLGMVVGGSLWGFRRRWGHRCGAGPGMGAAADPDEPIRQFHRSYPRTGAFRASRMVEWGHIE